MSGFRYRPFRTQPRRLSRMYLGRGFVTNNPPTITVPGAQSATSNVAKAISGTSIADADGNTQTVTLTVSHGTMTLASTTGLSFSVGDGTADATMTFSGSVANINTAIATITYTSTTNYEGADSLVISTDDGAGGTDSDSIAITVTFTPASISSLVVWFDANQYDYSDAGSTLAVDTDPTYRLRSVNDASTIGQQTTLGYRPIYTAGGNGKLFNLHDGSNDFLDVSNRTPFNFGTGDFTVVGLVYRTNTSVGRYFWSKQKATANYNGVGCGITGGFKPYFECFDGTGTVNSLTGATTLTSGSWYRMVFTRTGSTGTIYLNNTQDATGTVYSGSVDFAINGTIGCFSGGGQVWQGGIAHLSFYNAVLSSGVRSLLDTYLQSVTPT